MKRRHLAIVSLLFLAVAPLRAVDLNVFAAASLSDALKELAPGYEAKSGDKLHFNLGASNTLARQIEEGAPADVFFSADEAKMDDLAKAGLIAADTRVTLLSNTLVVVVSADRGPPVAQPADLATPAVQLIALAEPSSVPAGIYAREYLQHAGLWDKVGGKIVPTENVRGALTVIELGNADAAIVYRTDALISKKVRIAYAVPAADGPRIAYPLAVIKESKHADAARKFTAFLASAEARAVFAKYGFLPAVK
jgi:molybdate transport system substrate-binding protein